MPFLLLLAPAAWTATCPDDDGDGVCNDQDDCPSVRDPAQGGPYEPGIVVSNTIGATLAVDVEVGVADLDGDGLEDLLAAGLVEVEWWAGQGGAFAPDAPITFAIQVLSLEGADLDGDGDTDVLAGSTESGSGTWWVANQGGGTFGARQVIDADPLGPATAADLDQDGDLDVVYSSDDYVAWRENVGGAFFARRDVVGWVADATPEVPAVAIADLDQDGDPDVIAGQPAIAWYQNQGGGVFTPHTIHSFTPLALATGDLDQDGDLDVVAITATDVFAFENLGGTAFGFAYRVLADVTTFTDVAAPDVDGDGDADIVAVGSGGTAPGLYVIHSLQGFTFDTPLPLETDDGLVSIAAVDGDQDAWPDLFVGRAAPDPPYPPAGDVRIYPDGRPFPPDTDTDGLCDVDDDCFDPAVDGDGDGVCAESGDGTPLDCDDADPERYPGAPERCDGLDDACTGTLPADEADGDADGVRPCDGDCDDADAAVAPGQPEVCDARDNDCDGTVDDPTCDDAPPATEPKPEEGGCGCRSGLATGWPALLLLLQLPWRTRSSGTSPSRSTTKPSKKQ